MDLGKKRLGPMDWIDVAQDKYQWMALVNVLMKLPFP
jgi:hypothetical protein